MMNLDWTNLLCYLRRSPVLRWHIFIHLKKDRWTDGELCELWQDHLQHVVKVCPHCKDNPELRILGELKL